MYSNLQSVQVLCQPYNPVLPVFLIAGCLTEVKNHVDLGVDGGKIGRTQFILQRNIQPGVKTVLSPELIHTSVI